MNNSPNFELYTEIDERLKIRNKEVFPIRVGSSSYTATQIEPNSKSTSSIDWSFNPINEAIVMPRFMTIDYELNFILNCTGGIANGDKVLDLYSKFCLQSFILHRLSNHFNCVINNGSFDSDPQYELPALLRMMNEETLNEFGTNCPCQLDVLANNEDAVVGYNSNTPFKPYSAGLGKKNIPRGAYQISITSVNHNNGADNVLTSAGGNDTWEIGLKVKGSEPILFPPFSHGKWGLKSAPGFLGVTKMSIRYNLSSSLANRCFSSALPATALFNCTLSSVQDCKLNISYLENNKIPMPIKNVYKYYQVNSYVTSGTTTILAKKASSVNLTTNNIQLSTIPDKIALYARKKVDTLKITDSESYFIPIKLNVNFNGKSNLLSSLSTQDLYHLSKKNGLRSCDILQFIGEASNYNAGLNGVTSVDDKLFLSGSIIILDPCQDLSISSEFLTSGSGGQYNFSWSADFANPTNADSSSYEMVTLPMYTSYYYSNLGNTTPTSLILNQKDVAEVLSKGETGIKLSNEDDNELIGGSAGGMVNAILNDNVLKIKNSRKGMAKSAGKKSRLDDLLV